MRDYTKYSYKPNYDYSKLKGRIREKVGTDQNFLKLIGRSKNYLYKIYNNLAYFDQRDIDKACEVLEIPLSDIQYFFYTKSSQNENINEVI